MIKSRFSSIIMGRVAIAIGVLGFLEFPLLLLTVIGIDTYALIQFCYAVVGITSGILAIMLYTEYFKDSMLLGGIVAVLALVGSLIITRSVVLNFSLYEYLRDYKLIDLGFSLIGLWLLGLIFLAGYTKQLPRSLVVLGLVVGMFMALSFFGIPENIGIRTSHGVWEPWVKFPWLGFLQGEVHFEDMPDGSRWFFYPTWCIFFGRHLMRKPILKIAEN